MMKKMITLAALVGSFTTAAASPQITGLGCKLDAGKFAANVSFRDSASGATYYYKATVDQTSAGATGTTALYDAAGRTIASARSSSTSSDRVVSFGVGWTRSLADMLQDVMLDDKVQAQLDSCTAAASPQDNWLPWFCPILIFIWDEDLAAALCSWMPYPHPYP
jgi:hypothetical protein